MAQAPSLALFGGPAVRPQGPPDWPFPDHAVLEALQAAYQDGSWGKYHGGSVQRLEESLAQYHDLEFALSCGSGTFAVELALRALKIGPGAEVILSAYDFPGNFLAVHAVGAQPVLIDVAAHNGQMDPALLRPAFGPATRAIIVSHLHGGVVPMREVVAIAGEYGIRVIEDAAQMPGALVQGRKAGTWGDIGIMSFGGSKLLTAGRGGALLTRHADIHQRARLFMNRGNVVCPLSALQAAVLLPQLAQLDARNAQRSRNVSLLLERLGKTPGLEPLMKPSPDDEPGYYKLGFQFDSAAFGQITRERFLAALRAEGIAFDEGFRALHVGRSPRRFRQGSALPMATRAHESVVVLHHPVLLGSADDIDEVAVALRKVYLQASDLRVQ